ncbi:MAG: hypothetical protein QM500_04110 [Methylococcales bacterium]
MNNEVEDNLNKMADESEAETLAEGEVISQSDQIENDQAEKKAEMQAAFIVNAVAKGVNLLWECLEYDGTTKNKAVDKLKPLTMKYSQGEMPAWLLEWQDEIQAGLFFGAVAFESWRKVQVFNAAKEEAEKAEAEGVDNGDKSQHQPPE